MDGVSFENINMGFGWGGSGEVEGGLWHLDTFEHN